jgi:UV DNA damage repair endonuclease
LSCMYTYKKKTATNVIHGKINWSDNDCLIEKMRSQSLTYISKKIKYCRQHQLFFIRLSSNINKYRIILKEINI